MRRTSFKVLTSSNITSRHIRKVSSYYVILKNKVQLVEIFRCEHRGGPGAQVPADCRPLQGGDGQQLGQEEEHGDR